MKIKVILLCFLILTAFPKTKCGFISDVLGRFFGGIVDGATKGMIDNAKQAFRESMDYLFDNKLQPLIHQLEATADRVLDRAKDDINAVIDNFKNQMEDLVKNAANIATEFVDHTLEEIKTKIIDSTFDRLNKFEDKLFQDVTAILNKIDEIMKNVSCYAQAIIIRITDEIKKALPWVPNPFETCRIKLSEIFEDSSLRYKFISSFTPSQLYQYRKCNLINHLTGDSPILAVRLSYMDLEFLAGDMRCLSVANGSMNNEKYYIKEMGFADFILSTIGSSSLRSTTDKNLK
jgi:ElaB/YqjD/DUF883 family membrane-anchored ribosome-binding protein